MDYKISPIATLLAVALTLCTALAADNPAPQRLTDLAGDELHPRVSPDGRYLAFSNNRNGDYDLFIKDLTTGSITRITDSQADEVRPSWSRDGSRVVYQSNEAGCCGLWITNVEEPWNRERITAAAHYAGSPDWSPDGRRILYMSDAGGSMDAWYWDVETAVATQVTSHEGGEWHGRWWGNNRIVFYTTWGQPMVEVWGYDLAADNYVALVRMDVQAYRPFASPDERLVAYVADIDSKSDIWVTEIDTGRRQRVSPTAMDTDWPSISPDGRSVYFSGRDRMSQLFRLDIEDATITPLTDGSANVSEPEMSPDYDSILFGSDASGSEGDIYVLSVAGGDIEAMTNEQPYLHKGTWSPRGDRIAYTRGLGGDVDTDELWLLDLGSGTHRALTENLGYVNKSFWCDEDTIVFNRYRGQSNPVEIWSVRPDGSNLATVKAGTFNFAASDCSADGRTLLVTSDRSGERRLYTLPAGGGDLVELHSALPSAEQARWSPDEKRIAFLSSTGAHKNLFVGDPETGEVQQLTDDRYAKSWAVWSASGDALFFASNHGDNSIWRAEIEDFAPRIADIAWLTGHWRGIGDDGESTGSADSIWTNPVEGVMSLTFRWHQAGKEHVHFAFSVVEETPDGVLLRGIHHGRDFGAFEDANWTMRLADSGPGTARFVCVENCRAASVEFEQLPDGTLVESWRSVADAEPVFVITYQRSAP